MRAGARPSRRDMAEEIERRFLVADRSFLRGLEGVECTQGYIAGRERSAVRIRIKGGRGFLTIKSATRGLVRSEFEYEIPLEDAREMLELLCDEPLVEKTRYEVPFAGDLWEVDVFGGLNNGLVLAEIELRRADQNFEKPPWLGAEVSHDGRYFNSQLARRPYSTWGTAN